MVDMRPEEIWVFSWKTIENRMKEWYEHEFQARLVADFTHAQPNVV